MTNCHLVSQDGDKNEHADADSFHGHLYLVSPEIYTIFTSVIKVPLSIIVAVLMIVEVNMKMKVEIVMKSSVHHRVWEMFVFQGPQ